MCVLAMCSQDDELAAGNDIMTRIYRDKKVEMGGPRGHSAAASLNFDPN